jgi:hypothetical protein
MPPSAVALPPTATAAAAATAAAMAQQQQQAPGPSAMLTKLWESSRCAAAQSSHVAHLAVCGFVPRGTLSCLAQPFCMHALEL